MKKLLSVLIVLGISIGAFAQEVGYGVKAGLNLGKYSNVSDAAKDYQKMNPSFYVSGYADLAVAPQFSIQPGISLQGKGEKYDFDGDNMDGSVTTNVMALEIPVNAVYYIPTGSSGSVFLGAGPYVGYSLSGKTKVKGNVGDIWGGEGDYDLKFSGDDKDQKPFDFGVNFMAGYRLSNGFLINAGYGLGLSNLSPSDNSDSKFSNRVLSFGVGFQL
ncbi:porin family protein [Parapedobacter tibetensis]|uniref:porin family protein n=1 Tax=Parapedobacter tibetensis TaxID=2972951 RepID=UPI00214D4EBA|nr:porin family protein [Parapedobacter tibetensis]